MKVVRVDYLPSRHGVVRRVTLVQSCCGAANPHCDDPRPTVGMFGCDRCGHSGACHSH